jgi:hypothetical protein
MGRPVAALPARVQIERTRPPLKGRGPAGLTGFWEDASKPPAAGTQAPSKGVECPIGGGRRYSQLETRLEGRAGRDYSALVTNQRDPRPQGRISMANSGVRTGRAPRALTSRATEAPARSRVWIYTRLGIVGSRSVVTTAVGGRRSCRDRTSPAGYTHRRAVERHVDEACPGGREAVTAALPRIGVPSDLTNAHRQWRSAPADLAPAGPAGPARPLGPPAQQLHNTLGALS